MPKFGNLLAADVWAATARTLTDLSAEEIFDLPEINATYPGTSVNSSATANTFGSWTELSADVGVGKRLIGAFIMPAPGPVATPFAEIEFGEGGSGSEAAITRVETAGFCVSAAGYHGGFFVPLWRALTDNARLSARSKDDTAVAQAYLMAALIA